MHSTQMDLSDHTNTNQTLTNESIAKIYFYQLIVTLFMYDMMYTFSTPVSKIQLLWFLKWIEASE